jgi:hypothetical protein
MSNANMKPYWYAGKVMSTPTCSAGNVRPLLRNYPLLYPPSTTPRTMQDGGAPGYPSNYKPIPFEAILSSALLEISLNAKVFVDKDSSAQKSWSIRDTFEDQNAVCSTKTTRRVVVSAAPARRKNKPAEAKVLPIDFSPHPYSVICGRGGVRTDIPGNRYLQSLAGIYTLKYSQQAQNKRAKSAIVSHILEMVRSVCPDGKGAFIRAEKNRWIELNDLDAREKFLSVMRNGLHSKYRSSTKSKVAKRRYQKALKDEIRIEDGPLRSPEMAFSENLCSKYEPAGPTSKHDDEVFDLVLGGEGLSMKGFFE